MDKASPMHQREEKRSHTRLRMNCTVVFRLNEPASTRFIMSGQDMEAKMTDISQGGMALVTNYDIPLATELSMRFTLLKVMREVVNFSGPMEIEGEVKSNIPCGDNEHRLGIYFTKTKKINTKVLH
jgi:hypothetical protein